MSDHNDTQEIQLLTQEFKSFRKEISEAVARIEETVDTHSKEIWGKDDLNIGIKAKVTGIVMERAKEAEDRKQDRENRLWWRTLIAVPIVGVIIEWIVKLLNYIQQRPH